jgi:membrane-associated phospholipid phosphatase
MAQTITETPRRHPSARVLLIAVAAFLAAVPFTVLAVLVGDTHGFVVDLDRHTARSLHQYALVHPGFTDAMKVVSTIGRPAAWWVVMVPLFGWLVLARRWRLAAFVAVTAAGSPLLSQLLKHLVGRVRPVLAHPVATAAGRSFPSGHALTATVAFGILLIVFAPIVGRSVRIWLCLVAAVGVALIGFSRLALGVHFLSDVVGAVLIGTAWLLASAAAFSAWRRD